VRASQEGFNVGNFGRNPEKPRAGAANCGAVEWSVFAKSPLAVCLGMDVDLHSLLPDERKGARAPVCSGHR
ncbi:MAG: hypothetical protein ACREIC_30705, partial [Limisphaerales bacterium]